MSERSIPNTLQEKLLNERAELYSVLWLYEDCIKELLTGNVSAYSIGNRSVTKQNIAELVKLKDDTEARIYEIEGILSHRSARNVTVNSYLSPSICVPRTHRS